MSDTFLIDVLQGDRTGTNVDHLALTVADVDLDELATSGRLEVEMGPADLYGARGVGRGLYTTDPDGTGSSSAPTDGPSGSGAAPTLGSARSRRPRSDGLQQPEQRQQQQR